MNGRGGDQRRSRCTTTGAKETRGGKTGAGSYHWPQYMVHTPTGQYSQ